MEFNFQENDCRTNLNQLMNRRQKRLDQFSSPPAISEQAHLCTIPSQDLRQHTHYPTYLMGPSSEFSLAF
jgi:hypothetical protein